MYLDEKEGYESYGWDTNCVHCGKGISFEVGLSLSICPGCGKNYEKTDEQSKRDRTNEEANAANMKNPDFWINQMVDLLDSEISSLDMMMSPLPFGPPIPQRAMEKGRWLREKLRDLVKEIKKD